MILFAEYCFLRTRAAANSTAMASLHADVRIDSVGVEFTADMSRALMLLDMGKIFIAEVTEGCEDCTGG